MKRSVIPAFDVSRHLKLGFHCISFQPTMLRGLNYRVELLGLRMQEVCTIGLHFISFHVLEIQFIFFQFGIKL